LPAELSLSFLERDRVRVVAERQHRICGVNTLMRRAGLKDRRLSMPGEAAKPVMVIVPSGARPRVSGQAIDGSSILSARLRNLRVPVEHSWRLHQPLPELLFTPSAVR